MRWLEHFAKFTNTSCDNRHLILLDGHHSHKTLGAVEFCRENGIELLTLPPHSTHKLQPLDRSYFKPLKTAFNTEMDSWMVALPGKRVTIHDIAGLSGKAFMRTALPDRAVQGFRTCGLWPYDPNVFTDVDFEPVLMSEEDLPEVSPPTACSTANGTPSQQEDANGDPPEVRNQPTNHTPDQQTANVQIPTNHTPDQQTANVEIPANHTPDQQTANVEIPANHTPDQQTANVEIPANRTPDQQTANVEIPTNHTPDQQTVNVEIPANRTPDQQTANVEIPANRTPDQQTANVEIPAHQADVAVIKSSGDGRCLFRSLVIGMDRRLQTAQRNEHGKLLNTVLHAVETGKADSLRAQVISFMWDNYDEYKGLDFETINADLPHWICFGSMDERIVAMAEPTSLPGELELAATSKVLGKRIVVLGANSMVIQTYGEDTLPRLVVQFRNIGQDVGHYDCVLDRRIDEPQGPTSQDEIPEASSFSPPHPTVFPTPDQQTHPNPSSSFVPQEQRTDPEASTSRREEIAELIRGFSPLPKIQSKRPRSRKAESATVLTSSPFKARLEEKHSKQSVQKRQQERRQAKASQRKRGSVMNLKKIQIRKKRNGYVSFAVSPIATADPEMCGSSARFVSSGPMRSAPTGRLNSSVQIVTLMTLNKRSRPFFVCANLHYVFTNSDFPYNT